MGRFAAHLAAFGVLPLAYMGTVTLVDPFEFFGLRYSIVDSTWRAGVARAINPCLLKLGGFRRQPAAHVLLGDSRMASLPVLAVSARVGAPVANLAYGGASLQEVLDTFWFATRYAKLESVTIGLNLDSYNDYNIMRRTEAMQSMVDNPALYYTNRNVLSATWYALKSRATHAAPVLDRVNDNRDEFWAYTLGEQRLTFSRWRAPETYRGELKRMADWCRSNHVRLTFVRFPLHQDVEDIVDMAGLAQARSAMARELAALGTLVDFEGRRDVQDDRTKFADPIHFNAATGAGLIAEVWPGPVARP